MKRKLDLAEKIVCNKVGKCFSLATEKMSCYEVSFCKAWLGSQICKELVNMEGTYICQGANYYFNSLIEETKIKQHSGYEMDSDVMYWAGYILTFWMLCDGISAEKIISTYDIATILSQYDVLHTMSPSATIETIEKNYTIAKILLDNVLHGNN